MTEAMEYIEQFKDKQENMTNLISEAIRAYQRVCQNGTPILFPDGEYHCLSYYEPSEAMTEIWRKYVRLYNTNGLLAKYHIKARRIIV